MFDIFRNGGWVLIPLVLCSIVSVAVIVERGIYFRKIRAFKADELLKLVNQGQLMAALALAAKSEAPLFKVLRAGLEHRANPLKAMEAAGIASIAEMRRGLPALDTIITLSPLLGLLGTIIGMVDSFKIMAIAGSSQPHAVTGGVAEALIATATGIVVAVITLIPYNYFLARVERETEKIEEYATRLELALNQIPQELTK